MTTLGGLRKKIRTAHELSELVGTMETLAAVNIRQYEATAVAISRYVDTIEAGFQIVLKNAPELVARGVEASDAPRLGVVAFGSDQGICGAINSRATHHTLDVLEGYESPKVIAVGHRVSRALVDAGVGVDEELRPPPAVSSIAGLVSDILTLLGTWRADDDIERLVAVFNQPQALRRGKDEAEGEVAAGFDTLALTLLPLQPEWLSGLAEKPWESRRQPTFRGDPETHFSWLVREWLFARVYFACASSLAAENAARLAATQAAGRSIDERLTDLKSRYRVLRQTSITEELMDLYR